MFDVKAFTKKFYNAYTIMYDNCDKVKDYYAAVALFDDLCNNPIMQDMIRQFCEYRHDFVSSDREAAAFSFAFLNRTPVVE